MMPTIRIDDDVFEGLKSLAEPFTDTPNTVIRRMLAQQFASRVKSMPSVVTKESETELTTPRKSLHSIAHGTLTPQPVYEAYLLHVLATAFEGRATKTEATKGVIKLMRSHGFITDADLEHVGQGQTKAENTIAWGRNALKDRGLISDSSPRGVWELTLKGMSEGKKMILPTR